MKYWICLLGLLTIFLTDFPIAFGEIDPEIQIPVKEIGKENQVAGLEIGSTYSNTNESGAETLLPIRLSKQPIAPVIVRCLSQNQLEGQVLNGELTFTPDTWDKQQFCRVKGQDDDKVDGDQEFEILVEVASEQDREYARIPRASRTMLNRDNDRPGVVVDQTGNITSESGKTAGIALHLSSRPDAEVVVPLISSDKTEGVAKPASLLFTPGNWNLPQIVTIVGQDDLIADGTQSYSIEAGPLKSADTLYHGLQSGSVAFMNEDNDQAALIINPVSLVVGENGEETSLAFRLQSEPVAQVILTLTNQDSAQGDMRPHQLIFSPATWKTVQSVRVFGKDDSLADGDQPLIVMISSKQSLDKTYASLPDRQLTFSVKDDDTAGFVITPKTTTTTEKGGAGKIGIKLTSQPESAVILNFSSSNPAEGKPLLERITFDAADWFVEKTLTVIGMDDNQVDGDQPYTIRIDPPVTEDVRYRLLDPADVTLINQDDEKKGLQIEKAGDHTDETGAAVPLSLRLNACPTADVFLIVESSNRLEGLVAPEQLVFSGSNWDQPQTAVVTGQPDGLVDGDQAFQVRIASRSDDPNFQLPPQELTITNRDLNSFEIIHLLNGTETSESGKSSELQLKLNSNPGGRLPVSIMSADPKEGRTEPDRLFFDESNWSQWQKVTLLGVDDDLKDGTQNYELEVKAQGSVDSGFVRQPPVIIAMTNLDNDQAGISTRQISHEIAEAEGYAEFAIRLNSEPASSVIFIFSTSDETEGEMIDYHAAFFKDNWNREQVIRVKGVRDYVVDGTQKFQVLSLGAISQDPNYNKMAFPGFTMICHDSDQPGFTIENLSGRVSEVGDSAFFTLKLTTIPDFPVNIGFASDDQSEGIASPDSLLFNADNWSTGHKITVTGLDDGQKDGDTEFHIRFKPATSTDPNYSGRFPDAVPITNYDRAQTAFGFTFTRLEFVDTLQDKVEQSTATGLYATYVYSHTIDLDCQFYTLSSEGALTVSKYNLDNPMSYQLDYSGLMTGLKYFFWKRKLQASVLGGLEVAYWTLQSQNGLSNQRESNSGTALGLYAGFGVDFTVIGPVMLGLDWVFHYVARGFGNSQTVVALKYPF